MLMQAYQFSARFNRPRAYDAQYLAVAERLGCDFWIVYERLFNAVREQFPGIRWLGWCRPGNREAGRRLHKTFEIGGGLRHHALEIEAFKAVRRLCGQLVALARLKSLDQRGGKRLTLDVRYQ